MATTKVTTGGITDATIATADIADQAITLAKLPHGDGSSDGKFLRANNGADPTFETVTSTTINNNADNRVITGSGTANTLEGESDLTFSGNILDVNNAVRLPDAGTVHFGASDTAYVRGKDSTDGYVKLGTAGLDRVTVDPNGKVGIGTTSPDQKLHVHKGSAGSIDSTANSVLTLENSTDAILQFLSPSSNVNQIRFGDPSDNGAGFIDYDHNTNRLAFGTAGPERMRLDSSGQLLIGGTTLGAAGSFGIEPNGHVRSVLASGTTGDTLFGAISGVSNGFQVGISGTNVQRYSFHNGSTVTARIDSDGLKFMNDTAAANALDDYEEGSFTPTISGPTSISYNEQYGRYVKVGKLVTVNVRMQFSGVSSSGYFKVLGLPFTSATGNGETYGSGGITYCSVPLSTVNYDPYIGTATTEIQFYEKNSGGNITLASNCSNAYIGLAAFYYI